MLALAEELIAHASRISHSPWAPELLYEAAELAREAGDMELAWSLTEQVAVHPSVEQTRLLFALRDLVTLRQVVGRDRLGALRALDELAMAVMLACSVLASHCSTEYNKH